MNVELCSIHCTATPNGEEVSIPAIIKNHEERFSTPGRPWVGCGYHQVIQPNGDNINTRPLNEIGAHVAGHNTGNVGIALAGTDKFTIAQFNSLGQFLNTLRIAYSLKPEMIYCHNEFDTAKKQGKNCPFLRASDIVVWHLTGYWRPLDKYILPTYT